jgi:hypothetical protein
MAKSPGKVDLGKCNHAGLCYGCSLHVAAGEGRLDAMEELLAAGADCNEVLPMGAPLHLTAEFDTRFYQEEVVVKALQLLLARGANPNSTDKHGRTPLHLAVANGHLLCVQALLEGGANPNLKHVEGNTPLHTIVLTDNQKPHRQREAIARLLLVHGADLTIRNGDGKRPLDIALARNRTDLLSLFQTPPGRLARRAAPAPVPAPPPPPVAAPVPAPDKVAIECPSCGKPGSVPSSYLGKSGKCKGCGAAFVFRRADSQT